MRSSDRHRGRHVPKCFGSERHAVTAVSAPPLEDEDTDVCQASLVALAGIDGQGDHHSVTAVSARREDAGADACRHGWGHLLRSLSRATSMQTLQWAASWIQRLTDLAGGTSRSR